MKIVTDHHVCPLVPEHPVSVVHSDALPHPAKPQTKTAGKEGNQGGLPEKHTVRHMQHKQRHIQKEVSAAHRFQKNTQ